jgi:tetrahydromethanopterin S-methyltransferase subunit G
METSSTDKRIDDLASRVDRFEGDVKERFDWVDRRFERFEGDVKENFAKVDARFDKLEGKVDSTNHTIWAGIFVAVVVRLLFG